MRRAFPLLALVFAAACADRAESTSSPHTSIAANLECENCHTTEGWRIAGATGARGSGFDHRTTGFPLTGRHADAGCTACHLRNERVSRDCVSCHQDVHQGRLGRECAECHSSNAFTDVRAIELHRRTQLPLTGMHAIADCTECHRRTTSATWSAVPADCFACHEDAYRRTDIHPPHVGGAGAPFPRDCAQCHVANGWVPAYLTGGVLPATAALSAPSDHEPRFPLASGPHHGLPCESCHTSPDQPRLFGCTGCHAHDVGTLAAQHHGLPLLDGPGCLSCHPGGSRR